MATKTKFYAVAVGRKPGIYAEWYGADGAEAQVRGFSGARFQGFPSREAAQTWLAQQRGAAAAQAHAAPRRAAIDPLSAADRQLPRSRQGTRPGESLPRGGAPASETGRKPPHDKRQNDAAALVDELAASALAAGQVVVFTDGACTGNPGPGGWAAVLRDGEHRTEISGGFARTTNNRMELTACIAALRLLQRDSKVVLFSDSSYVTQAIEKGWAKRWRAKRWMRNTKEPAENPDLWAELLELCEKHTVKFVWLRGHAGHPENERCDQLAVAAAHRPNLPADPGYKR